MLNTKHIMSKGLAFAEGKEMETLSKESKEGWLLYKFGILGYKLKKAAPQKLQYSIDYRSNADEEYFSYFKEAGWTHACSIGNAAHIFSAPEGTAPIYTDNTESEKYISQYEQTKSIAIPSSICSIIFVILTLLSKYNYISGLYMKIFGIPLMVSAAIAAISVYTCIAFYSQIDKTIENKKSIISRKYNIAYKPAILISVLAACLFILNKFNVINISNIILYIVCFIGALFWLLVALKI